MVARPRADIQGSGERGRSNDVLGSVRVGALGLTASSANSVDFPWFATFRGRAGFLADPSLLLYVTGGLAVGEVEFTTQPTLTGQFFDGNTPIGAPITAVGPSDRIARRGWAGPRALVWRRSLLRTGRRSWNTCTWISGPRHILGGPPMPCPSAFTITSSAPVSIINSRRVQSSPDTDIDELI
jgi:hypothetical protein